MDKHGITQCLNMGVTGGIISPNDADEVKNKLFGMDSLITRGEAAELIKRTPETIDRYAREKRITKINTDFGPRFDRNELIALATGKMPQAIPA